MQLYKNCFSLFTLNISVVKKRHSNIASPIIFLLLLGLSNVLFAQTPPFPAPNISASLAGSEWTISWWVSGTVDHYDLYSSNSRGAGLAARLPATTRFYKTTIASEYLDFEVVACYASNQCGAFSKSVRIRPPLPKLAAPVISTTLSGLDWIISWTKPAGEVDHYLLSESTCCAGAGRIIPAGTLQYTSTFARDYLNYAVQACDINNICGDISEKVRVDAPPAFAAPVITQARTGSAYTTYWSTPAGAVSYYELESDTQDGVKTERLAANTTSHKAGAGPVKYRVRACNANSVCGTYSENFFFSFVQLISPPAISKTLSGEEWTVSWISPQWEISDIAYYHVLEASADGLKQYILPTNTTSLATTPTVELSYSVQACYSDGVCSDYSETIITAPLFAAPIVTQAKTGSAYTAYWSAPAGPVSYYELASYFSRGGPKVKTFAANVTSFKSSDTDSAFYVRACDVNANCGEYSAGFNFQKVTSLSAPSISTTQSGDEWTISWVSPASEMSEIAYYNFSGFSEIGVMGLTLPASTTYYRTNPNVDYTYYVAACYSDNVCSGSSAKVMVTPTTNIAPKIVSPANGAIVNAEGDHCFTWTRANIYQPGSVWGFYFVSIYRDNPSGQREYIGNYYEYDKGKTSVCWGDGSGWKKPSVVYPDRVLTGDLKEDANYSWYVDARNVDSNGVQVGNGITSGIYKFTIAKKQTPVTDSEAAIRALWGDVAKSLIAGDKNILAQKFDASVINKYSQVFDALDTQLAEIGKQLGDIEPLYVNEDTAVYMVTKKGDNGGDYLHTIKFKRNANGEWKVSEL
jgi:hypothetical protein